MHFPYSSLFLSTLLHIFISCDVPFFSYHQPSLIPVLLRSNNWMRFNKIGLFTQPKHPWENLFYIFKLMIFSYRMSYHTRSAYIMYNTFRFVVRHEDKHFCHFSFILVFILVRVRKKIIKLLKCYLSSNKEKLCLVHASSFVKKHFRK